VNRPRIGFHFPLLCFFDDNDEDEDGNHVDITATTTTATTTTIITNDDDDDDVDDISQEPDGGWEFWTKVIFLNESIRT